MNDNIIIAIANNLIMKIFMDNYIYVARSQEASYIATLKACRKGPRKMDTWNSGIAKPRPRPHMWHDLGPYFLDTLSIQVYTRF